MSKIFKPQTYKDWLNELNFSSKEDEMINAATNAGRIAADKKAARHDISLVLATKYQNELIRAGHSRMLISTIEERFENVAQEVFKSKFSSLLNYIRKAEPEFDRAGKSAEEKSPLGFIKAKTYKDEKGRVRAPLGFLGQSEPRVSKNGQIEPGLGFLSDDTRPGSLGFL